MVFLFLHYETFQIFGFDFCLPADANKSNAGGPAAAAPTWTFNPQVMNEDLIIENSQF